MVETATTETTMTLVVPVDGSAMRATGPGYSLSFGWAHSEATNLVFPSLWTSTRPMAEMLNYRRRAREQIILLAERLKIEAAQGHV